nr:VCBS domain-containing protein [Kordiimonas marina]
MNGTITITDSSFTGNGSGNALQFLSPTSVAISGSVIAHNNWNGVVTTGPTDISNSVFTGNGNAELVLSTNAAATVSNSIFAGAGTPIGFVSSPQTLTFSGTNVVSATLGGAYSGTTPTVESTLTNIFDAVSSGGGTLSAITTSSGATIYTALVNTTGAAQGLGPAYPATIGGDTTGTASKLGSTNGTLTISDLNGASEESFTTGTVNGTYGHLTMAANGAWTYSPNTANSSVTSLTTGSSLHDTVAITSVDGTSQNINITITGGNSAPSGPTLTSGGVEENDTGAFVGTLSATDPEGSAVTFSTDDSRFVIKGDELWLKDGVSLDYESEHQVTLQVSSSDTSGLKGSAFVNFSVGNVTEQKTEMGGVGQDSLQGSNSVDQNNQWARGGDDHLTGSDGSDRMGGGDGNDTLWGGAGSDTLFGGTGDDVLSGGNGNDLLYNGQGNDSVDGGAGNDTIWASAGDDTLTGGDGADTFVFGANSGNDTITDFNISQDTLDLSYCGFADRAAVYAAASYTLEGDNRGLHIDLGDGNSVFLAGLIIDLDTLPLII